MATSLQVVGQLQPSRDLQRLPTSLLGYNFDFDFFRSDRLVCTEVVYRAFDGLEGLDLPLVDRAGRPTLAAFDFAAKRGDCRSGFPDPDPSWTSQSHEWDDAAFDLFG